MTHILNVIDMMCMVIYPENEEIVTFRDSNTACSLPFWLWRATVNQIAISLYNGTVLPSSCTPSTFQYPILQGADFLTLNTNYVSNYSAYIVNGYYPGHPNANVVGASFCNVSVSYTRPGQNNTINAQVWLPTTWNGRMQGIGGGGFGSGLYDTVFQGMYASVGDGFATVSNDAGLPQPMNVTAPEWALTSTGNVNLYALQNFASISLNDGAVIAKSIIRQYYGQNSSYRYWSGCSGGGRQGMMLAQEAPDAYDGIMAGSPAMNWPSFFVADYWPQTVQQELGVVPLNCELDALSAAAVAQCDGDDGLIDGVVSFPELCKFDPRILVGTTVANCSDTGVSQVISPAAATVALAVWEGAKDVVRNESLWYGFSRDATLTSESGLAGPDYFISPEEWVKRFIFKDASTDTSNIMPSDVAELFHKSVQWYQSLIGTADPNLDKFKANGGKIVSFHGLADGLISPWGTQDYYDKVTARDSAVHDYYRLFFAPGLQHCYGGNGAYPETAFGALVNWVENGVAPETLNATSLPTRVGGIITRPLCAYPKQQFYEACATRDCFVCK